MVRYIIVLALLLCLCACDNLSSGPRFEGDVYSIAGLLMAGASISEDCPVYITRSSSLDDWDLSRIFVQEAQVEIIELGSALRFPLEAVFDPAEMKIKWVDPQSHTIKALETYRVEVRIPGYDPLISAETTVPPMAELVDDYLQQNVPGEGYSYSQNNMPQLPYSVSDSRYPLALDLGEHGGVYNLLAELYCLEEFSSSLEFTTKILGQTHATADMEESYYAAGEGIRRIRFINRFSADQQPEQDGNYIVLRDYRQGFIFYGRYRVSMMVADDNYYKYNFMPEGYLHGGVENALGYFGSASGGTLYTNIVKP
ncbi:MAG: hypothetical protein WCY87_04435 [Candidatus Cloacimonadales bacterium]|nr:hypothetical protein [Candidatus Cloacimonadota bacterium]MDY0381490.1 hypothetical protein [Candidatus Cloacimonadaceae bacterium]HCX59857.1 hypothetical protein [Candidatus Cloacimonas sp.]MCB5264127.1 hypothetical protein [Candidatus Cloacimonadota bacterium]MCB5276706.1 hypothetical protein [Candidatus Cloacimonadota bacterium]